MSSDSRTGSDYEVRASDLPRKNDREVSQTMPVPPEPMLLFVTVASVSYALLWRWWWRTIENVGVELSYTEDPLREAEE